jgi:phosphoenolpyruvate synthase/pyruvate phosphate dikinase
MMCPACPAGGDSDRIVIEGAFGLGEAVVSGAVSPDRYVVGSREDAARLLDGEILVTHMTPPERDTCRPTNVR